jgi:hypothetical protein
LEYLVVKCRPFYLLKEFSAVILTVVHIPPQDKKNKLALNEQYEAINKQESVHPEAAFLVGGDFNSESLRHMMPNFHQPITLATRGDKVRDHCSTHKQAQSPPLFAIRKIRS